MSIQTCRECTHPVSSEASACTRCGAPTELARQRQGRRGLAGLAVFVVLVVVAIVVVIILQQRSDARTACGIEAAGENLSKGSSAYEEFVDECLAR